MKKLFRTSSARWTGNGLEGKGTLDTQSGVFKAQPYSFHTRFAAEDGRAGTNPEELVAAAHAGCFAMALSFGLTGAGFTPTQLDVSAKLTMQTPDVNWTISGVHLTLVAKVPGISAQQFQEIAQATKASCPISKVLSCDLTLDATLA